MEHRTMRRLLLLSLLPLLAAAGADVGAAAAEEEAPPRGALSSGGSFYVTYETEPDPIPLNQLFTIRFRVVEADDRETLVKGAAITADPYMPEHKHGATLQPKIDSPGDGTAVGRGFLLHMAGKWELRVGIAAAGQMERATFEIQLEP
jgi:hypothetical protein